MPGSLEIATVFGTPFAVCGIEENPPHRLSSGAKEMPSTVPVLGLIHIHHPDVGLMYQSRCLQSLPRILLSHVGCGQFPQLIIDKGQ